MDNVEAPQYQEEVAVLERRDIDQVLLANDTGERKLISQTHGPDS
jgi:hypothetical protein